MTHRLPLLASLLALLLAACDTASPPASTDATVRSSVPETVPESGCVTGTQSSGSLYEICQPTGGNPTGTLVLYAHGFVFPQLPVALPEDAAFEGLFLSQGVAYGTTSFSTNGIVPAQTATKDLRELVTLYTRLYGRPETVLLFGVSNGALLSALTLEQNPGLFDGALAVCGPVGSYVRNVDYLGDISVVFDAIFPEVLDGLFGVEAGGPDGINPLFLGQLAAAASAAGVSPRAYLAGALQTALTAPANLTRTQQALAVIAATPDIQASFASPAEGLEAIITGVLYSVFATNDAIEKTGGLFYDNTGRVYVGLDNDAVARYAADRNARRRLETQFETSGRLRTPLVALHTTRDPLVPFWQEQIYADEVTNPSLFDLTPIDRFGHCAFQPAEIAGGFAALLARVSGSAL